VEPAVAAVALDEVSLRERRLQTAAVQGYGSPPPGPGEEAGYVQMQ